jgi:acyl transferase domain-containing protein
MFPDVSWWYPGAAADLLGRNANLRKVIEKVANALERVALGMNVLELAMGLQSGQTAFAGAAGDTIKRGLGFAVEYGLAMYLLSLIGAPSEFVAMGTGALARDVVTGVLKEEDALECIIRGSIPTAATPAAEIGELLKSPAVVFIEAGPEQELSRMVRKNQRKGVGHIACGLLGVERDTADTERIFLNAVGTLWCRGLPISWNQLYGADLPRRTSLPPSSLDGRVFPT